MSNEIEVEGMKIKGATIRNLLSPKFIKEIEAEKIDLEAVSLVLVREEEQSEGVKKITSVVIGHQNSQEIKDKIIHLNCSDGNLIKKMSDVIIKSNKN